MSILLSFCLSPAVPWHFPDIDNGCRVRRGSYARRVYLALVANRKYLKINKRARFPPPPAMLPRCTRVPSVVRGSKTKRGREGWNTGRQDEQRKDEANVSLGVGISGRCATALPGSHLWGHSSPYLPLRGPPRWARSLPLQVEAPVQDPDAAPLRVLYIK